MYREGQKVKVSFTGTIITLDSHDECMQIRSGDAHGYNHYVYPHDPLAEIEAQEDLTVVGTLVVDADGEVFKRVEDEYSSIDAWAWECVVSNPNAGSTVGHTYRDSSLTPPLTKIGMAE